LRKSDEVICSSMRLSQNRFGDLSIYEQREAIGSVKVIKALDQAKS